MKTPKAKNVKGHYSHVSKVSADDMAYQVNQYEDSNDANAMDTKAYHSSKGMNLIPGVHRKRNAGSPFENYVTRGKSG